METTLSRKIRHYRKSKGLSQEELADSLNCSTSAVSRMETGESVPSLDRIKQLSEALEVPEMELIRDEGVTFNIQHNESAQGINNIEQFHSIPVDVLEKILARHDAHLSRLEAMLERLLSK